MRTQEIESDMTGPPAEKLYASSHIEEIVS